MGGGGGSMVRDICLANCNLLQEISNYFVMSFCELEKKKQLEEEETDHDIHVE